ncbi:unnamed protein product [Ectocarpus sp. CCAP 1310/34]|nr:unnamed protein product [Ectocarpus sp. CCAP 1310/34]
MAQPTPALVEQPALGDGSSPTTVVAAASATKTVIPCTPSGRGGGTTPSYIGSPPTSQAGCPADVLPPLRAAVTTMDDTACGGGSGGCAASEQDFTKPHGGSATTEKASSCSGSSRSSRCNSCSRGASEEEKIVVEGFDSAPFAAAEKEEEGEGMDGSGSGSEVSGTDAGVGLMMEADMRAGLSARKSSRTSTFRQSSGDVQSLAAAAGEQQERGELPQDLGNPRGVSSPATVVPGPYSGLRPKTPDQKHITSSSRLKRGCAEVSSPRRRASTPASAATNGSGVEKAAAPGGGILRPPGGVAPKPPHGSAFPAEATGGELQVGAGSTPGTVRDHPALAAPAAAGLPVPVDGRGRAGRDYGPGIPVTRVASWSTFGDEGGDTIFGNDQADAARRRGEGGERGEEGSSQIRVAGEGLRRQELKGASSAGTPGQGANDDEESLRSADWATNNQNGKASFLSDEDRAIEAAQGGDLAAMKAFLDGGGDIELRDSLGGMTLLAWASRRGHTELARLLLSRGASATARDGRDRTPLHRACSGCNPDVVKALLEAGADPNARDQTWRTPLHRAARWGSPGCSTMLLEAGADIEARDKELARTPLHFASRSGGLETTLVLLNNGADLDAKTVAGNTPLHLACDRGLLGNAKLLMEWGADATAKNEAGALPAEVAAPWVEDSVKASMQELLAPRSQPSEEGSDCTSHTRPTPAVVRPRPKGAAEEEAGLMEFIRSQRNSVAECPECQRDMLRQTHASNSNGVPIGVSSAHGTYRISSSRSPGKVKMCSAHRARAQPGKGGLPGLDDGFQRGALGDAMLGEGMSEFRPRKGMGKSRKKQLSAKSKYEGGCCSVQ